VEGPETGKVQGDRYMTTKCEGTAVDGCDASGNNSEYSASDSKGYQGYFYVVKVNPEAVGKTIDLQLYDPAFVYTGQQCELLTAPVTSNAHGDYNDYTATDQTTRYSTASGTSSPSMCPGDYFPGAGSGDPTKHPMTTSYVLRNQTDTQNPMMGGVTQGTDGKACIKQYAGYTVTPTEDTGLREWNNGHSQVLTTYNQQLSKVFHQWTSLCSFTPTHQGDYYLQVRTNVALAGTPESNVNGKLPIVYQGNAAAAASNGNTTTGEGANAFAIRAVVPGYEKYVAVAGYDRLPIYQNGTASTATFNLIRVLPGARGYSISFNFFDAGDATSSGSIKVLPPTDATGSITTTPFPTSCTAQGAGAGSGTVLSSCTAPISNAANNGKNETMTIPIPSDYTCDYAHNNGCWYRVQVTFPAGAVRDTTTWTAGIISDPVRLVQ
jgi:hypothetical protein